MARLPAQPSRTLRCYICERREETLPSIRGYRQSSMFYLSCALKAAAAAADLARAPFPTQTARNARLRKCSISTRAAEVQVFRY